MSFWKSNHFTNIVFARQNRNQTINTKREAAVRRCPIFKWLQEETKTRVSILVGYAELAKHPPLQIWFVNSNRARAELPTVEHQVVRLAAHLQRLGLEQVHVVGVRLGVHAGDGTAEDVL